MSDVNSNFDKMDSLFFTTSNKGHRLLVMNEQIYRCNKKLVIKNIGFVWSVDVQYLFIQMRMICIYVVVKLIMIMNQIQI